MTPNGPWRGAGVPRAVGGAARLQYPSQAGRAKLLRDRRLVIRARRHAPAPVRPGEGS